MYLNSHHLQATHLSSSTTLIYLSCILEHLLSPVSLFNAYSYLLNKHNFLLLINTKVLFNKFKALQTCRGAVMAPMHCMKLLND